MVRYLAEELELDGDDVYVIDGPLNVPDLMSLYALDRPGLKDAPLQTATPAPLRESKSVFDAIRKQDILLHHPFTSYATVTDFINAAAHDADVLAIKMCLYRTGQHSPIVQALMEASARGKQVAVLVELKARFDEEKNIEWARRRLRHPRPQDALQAGARRGTVARIAWELIINPSAQASLLGNHTLEAEQIPFQVASFRAVAHPVVRQVVLPLPTFLPRRRRDDARARTRSRSHDCLSLGTALWP